MSRCSITGRSASTIVTRHQPLLSIEAADNLRAAEALLSALMGLGLKRAVLCPGSRLPIGPGGLTPGIPRAIAAHRH